MNGKIMMGVMACMFLCVGMVSAASVSDVNVDYNKKDNKAYFDFGLNLVDECSVVEISIYDHKDNVVSYNSGWFCGLCFWYRGELVCSGSTPTGTFEKSQTKSLIPKNEIKGLGNLRYEMRHIWEGGDLLAEGRLK